MTKKQIKFLVLLEKPGVILSEALDGFGIDLETVFCWKEEDQEFNDKFERILPALVDSIMFDSIGKTGSISLINLAISRSYNKIILERLIGAVKIALNTDEITEIKKKKIIMKLIQKGIDIPDINYKKFLD